MVVQKNDKVVSMTGSSHRSDAEIHKETSATPGGKSKNRRRSGGKSSTVHRQLHLSSSPFNSRVPDEGFWPASIISRAKQLSAVPGPVLVIGETGTGKTTLCEAIHIWSDRPPERVERVPCGTFQPTMLLTRLFGHKAGTFTDAREDRVGLLKSLDGGSVILDDLDCLTHHAQAALLGFLDTACFCREGEDGIQQRADVRILATCNRDPADLLAQGLLREDFYYRIRSWVIRLPPLDGRPSLIERMANRFLRDFLAPLGRVLPSGFSGESLELLAAIRWKGNLRALDQAVKNIALSCDSSNPVIQVEAAAQALFDSELFSPAGLPVWSELQPDDRIYRTLALTRWNVRLTARILGLSHQTIYNRINTNGWQRPG